MQDHLQDTEVKLSQCVRCKSYVFACQVSGLKIAVDPVPLAEVENHRAALIAGRQLYGLVEMNGKPWKLKPWRPDTRLAVLASHACGAHGMDAARVQEVAARPPSAPASVTTVPAARGALSGAQTGAQGFGPASGVTPLRSERPPRCARCSRPCEQGTYVGIDHPRFKWAEHVGSCP
jgi:hypothetical protein